MEYLIIGNTFPIKEDLKAHGCHWDKEKKCWKTPYLEKQELSFKRLESLTLAVGAEMVPINLTEQSKKIQEIINGITWP